MSDDARLALTIICFVGALLAQLGGLVLVVREARAAGRALRRWQAAEAQGFGAQGSGAQGSGEPRSLVPALLGNPFDRTAAVVLLGAGVLLGAAGNLLSL